MMTPEPLADRTGSAPWVVLVHYGDPARTARAIGRALETRAQLRSIVVDNGGNWRGSGADVVLRPGRNRGFAAGANLGARHAIEQGATHVWFLNNDAEPGPMAVDRLLSTASANGSPAMVGSVEVEASDADADGPESNLAPALPTKVRGLVVSHDRSRRYDFVSGFSVLVDREVFTRIGYFDETFFHYYEDVEYSIRAALAGVSVVLDRKSRITHVRGTQLGRESRQAIYYFFRNRLLLAGRYSRAPRPWLLLTSDRRNGIAPLFSRRRVLNRDWNFLLGAWLGTLDGILGRSGKRSVG